MNYLVLLGPLTESEGAFTLTRVRVPVSVCGL